MLSKKNLVSCLIFIFCLPLFAQTPPSKSLNIVPDAIKDMILKRASVVLTALKNQDMTALASLTHPTKGLRFSPYTHVEKSDLVFQASQIKKLMWDKQQYDWGLYDGSGLPIHLTFKKYWKSFIYSHDFTQAKRVSVNEILVQGNTTNNQFEFYPKALIVEYHFPGFDPKFEDLDWESLRLVFEEEGGIWYLSGIIHDQWTI